MNTTLQDLTRRLLALSKSASDEKVLPQEMRLIQEKAFEIQSQMMQLLDEEEQKANDIPAIQNIFQIREDVWDIMNNLAIREAEIKAKFGIKGESPKTKHTCCCQHEKCTCTHEHRKNCKKEKQACRKK